MLDVGSMGAPGQIHLWVSTNSSAGNTTMNVTDVPPDMNLASYTLHIWGEQVGGLEYKFVPFYSMGSFTRNLDEAICSDSDQPTERCDRDVTGFDPPPDSMPSPTFNGMNNAPKAGDAGMSADAIRRLVGAPVMDVTQVRPAIVTIRPASCSSRPARPPWPSPPADCPSWFLAKREHGTCNEAPSAHASAPCWENWDLDATTEGSPGSTACESGTCFFIDVHIELGGPDLADRTAFGNPSNDATGSKGTFFIYDPSVDVETSSPGSGSVEQQRPPGLVWVAHGLGLLLLVSCCSWCWCLGWCRRGTPAAAASATGKPATEADALLNKA